MEDRLTHSCNKHAPGRTGLFCTSDAETTCTFGADGSIRIWHGDATSPDESYKISEYITAAVIKKDCLFVATDDNAVQILTLPDGIVEGFAARFTAPPTCLSVYEAGWWLLAGAADFSIKLVRFSSAGDRQVERTYTYEGHTAPILNVRFEPTASRNASDGDIQPRRFASVSCDGSLRFWEAETERCIAVMSNFVPRSNDVTTSDTLCKFDWFVAPCTSQSRSTTGSGPDASYSIVIVPNRDRLCALAVPRDSTSTSTDLEASDNLISRIRRSDVYVNTKNPFHEAYALPKDDCWSVCAVRVHNDHVWLAIASKRGRLLVGSLSVELEEDRLEVHFGIVRAAQTDSHIEITDLAWQNPVRDTLLYVDANGNFGLVDCTSVPVVETAFVRPSSSEEPVQTAQSAVNELPAPRPNDAQGDTRRGAAEVVLTDQDFSQLFDDDMQDDLGTTSAVQAKEHSTSNTAQAALAKTSRAAHSVVSVSGLNAAVHDEASNASLFSSVSAYSGMPGNQLAYDEWRKRTDVAGKLDSVGQASKLGNSEDMAKRSTDLSAAVGDKVRKQPTDKQSLYHDLFGDDDALDFDAAANVFDDEVPVANKLAKSDLRDRQLANDATGGEPMPVDVDDDNSIDIAKIKAPFAKYIMGDTQQLNAAMNQQADQAGNLPAPLGTTFQSDLTALSKPTGAYAFGSEVRLDTLLEQLPAVQRPFQSGASQSRASNRYLVWNLVGVVTAYRPVQNEEGEDQDNPLADPSASGGSLEVEFHDATLRHAIHLGNADGYSVACLNDRALLLAHAGRTDGDASDKRRMAELDESLDDADPDAAGGDASDKQAARLSRVTIHRFTPVAGEMHSSTWCVPRGESVQCAVLARSYFAVGTDRRTVHLFTLAGLQVTTFCLPAPLVTMCCSETHLVVVHYAGAFLNFREHTLAYTVYRVRLDSSAGMPFESFAKRNRLFIEAVCEPQALPLSPKAGLKWIGFSQSASSFESHNVLYTVDSTGVVRRQPFLETATGYRHEFGCWMPVLNLRKICKSKLDTVFVVGVNDTERTLYGVYCKQQPFPALHPRPAVMRIRLRIEPCYAPHVAAAKLRYDADHKHSKRAFDATFQEQSTDEQDEWLDEEARFGGKLLNLYAFGSVVQVGVDGESVVSSANDVEMEEKSLLMRLFAIAVRNEDDQRALEIASLMPDYNTMQLAVRYATRAARRVRLVEQLTELAQRRVANRSTPSEYIASYQHDDRRSSMSALTQDGVNASGSKANDSSLLLTPSEILRNRKSIRNGSRPGDTAQTAVDLDDNSFSQPRTKPSTHEQRKSIDSALSKAKTDSFDRHKKQRPADSEKPVNSTKSAAFKRQESNQTNFSEDFFANDDVTESETQHATENEPSIKRHDDVISDDQAESDTERNHDKPKYSVVSKQSEPDKPTGGRNPFKVGAVANGTSATTKGGAKAKGKRDDVDDDGLTKETEKRGRPRKRNEQKVDSKIHEDSITEGVEKDKPTAVSKKRKADTADGNTESAKRSNLMLMNWMKKDRQDDDGQKDVNKNDSAPVTLD